MYSMAWFADGGYIFSRQNQDLVAIFYWACYYLSMSGFNLIYVSESGPGLLYVLCFR